MEPTFLCIPVYDDWEAVSRLLDEIDAGLASHHGAVQVLLVDDASPRPAPEALRSASRSRIAGVEILRLRRNLGHQRAIAIGLCHLYAHSRGRAVAVLDGDGEDTPDGLFRLLAAFAEGNDEQAVFARRERRSESVAFRVGYRFYKLAHRALTGRPVEVGNFSVLPWSHLHSLVITWELWNHYAAAFFKSGLARRTLPIPRGPRYAGQPRMNFVALVVHGLGAIAVYADVVGVRLLIATLGVLALSLGGILVAAGIRLFTDLAIPGWATTSIGVLGVAAFQAIGMMVVLVFVTLQGRDASRFLPLRDYALFVDEEPDARRPRS